MQLAFICLLQLFQFVAEKWNSIVEAKRWEREAILANSQTSKGVFNWFKDLVSHDKHSSSEYVQALREFEWLCDEI